MQFLDARLLRIVKFVDTASFPKGAVNAVTEPKGEVGRFRVEAITLKPADDAESDVQPYGAAPHVLLERFVVERHARQWKKGIERRRVEDMPTEALRLRSVGDPRPERQKRGDRPAFDEIPATRVAIEIEGRRFLPQIAIGQLSQNLRLTLMRSRRLLFA